MLDLSKLKNTADDTKHKIECVTNKKIRIPNRASKKTVIDRHNFRLIQIESVCIQENKYGSKNENFPWKCRKHSGKRIKCWLPAFYPFPAMFSKGSFCRVVKSRDCVRKG